MPRFIYKAKSGPKDFKEGVIDAETERAAIYKISQLGFYPLQIWQEQGESKPHIRKKIPLKDLASFTRQLADLLGSGLSLLNALEVLSRQANNARFKSAIDDVHAFIKDGGAFSEGLARHPEIFSNIYVSMVKAGETGGMLEEILNRLADYAEGEDRLKDKIRSVLAYPSLMAAVGLGTIMVLLVFVIPRIVTIFEDMGQALPLPTLILIGLSSFLVRYGWLLLIALAAAVFIFNRQAKTREGKFFIDRLKIKFFLIGPVILKAEIARFSKTLSTLLSNGVPIMQALKISSSVVENEVIRRDVEEITKNVISGVAFSKAIVRASSFPFFAVNVIAVGDESGHLEKALHKVSESCEHDVDRSVRVFTSLLEPFIILIMGGVVGFIVISMLLPIFQINLMAR